MFALQPRSCTIRHALFVIYGVNFWRLRCIFGSSPFSVTKGHRHFSCRVRLWLFSVRFCKSHNGRLYRGMDSITNRDVRLGPRACLES